MKDIGIRDIKAGDLDEGFDPYVIPGIFRAAKILAVAPINPITGGETVEGGQHVLITVQARDGTVSAYGLETSGRDRYPRGEFAPANTVDAFLVITESGAAGVASAADVKELFRRPVEYPVMGMDEAKAEHGSDEPNPKVKGDASCDLRPRVPRPAKGCTICESTDNPEIWANHDG